jgi:CubicO group peptidase (beta-lactamase class C family)
MERDSLVRIYSMTKPIAAVGLMMLYEEGAFQLNDPVDKYLPEFGDLKVLEDDEEVKPLRKMSIHHILTHTAGLTYGFFGNTAIDQRYRQAGALREKNLEEMVDDLGEIPLLHHPGEKWHYSVAVDVQGALIERLSGIPLDRFFRERIFEPLGMNDTFFEVPADKLDRFAANYRYDSGEKIRKLSDSPSESRYAKPVTFFSAGGGLVSTAADYWKFSQMLLNEGYFNNVRLFGRKTVELMTQDHLPAVLEEPDPNSDFGFGLGFRVIKDVPSTATLGSVGEYNRGGAAGTIFWVDPKEELIAVVMIQLSSSPYNLRREMKSLIYQALID